MKQPQPHFVKVLAVSMNIEGLLDNHHDNGHHDDGFNM